MLDKFRAGELRVIVATDVAGRGIHVDNISHVVNFDLPYEAENYVHRIGRTGRAGETGRAVSFACEQRSFVIPDIESLIERELTVQHPDPEMLVLPPPKHQRPERQEPVSRHSRSRGPRRRSGRRR